MSFVPDYTTASLAAAVCAAIIVYGLVLAIYRLWLSPVSGFPGAFWAKVTFWYEFYYDWVKPGQYYRRIREMHQQYGPIIRVSPTEVHIEDPLFYHEVFLPANVRRTDAYQRYAQGTGFEDIFAMVGTHEGHKLLRDPVEKLYSKILTHEPTVFECVRTFCGRLNKKRDTGKVLNLSHACLSLAIDVATRVTFQGPSHYLNDPTFNEKLFNIQKSGLVYIPLFAHLPAPLRLVSQSIGQFLASYIPEFREWDEIIQQNGIFHVSSTIQTVITQLCLDEKQRRKVQDELATFWAEHPQEVTSLYALRKLPYLTACLYEGLRLGAGALNRSPRVFPDDEIVYKGWFIPKGTPFSMTSHYMHMDPTVFPEPGIFNPARWFGPGSEPEGIMHKYLIPFGKGSRACAGPNIAWMQMYFAISQLYQPSAPEIRLFESDESDVRLEHGYIFPLPRLESRGVRIIIRGSHMNGL
ncbi:hypothetical protein BDW74DRAFT_176683 [Aspergillus multicolor]|uniref:cytochrome P450 n=1 Tax=Aspergillus multicolor TaxID=41759 RepID=UPI003CCCCF7B